MTIVVDASIALKWVLDEPVSDAAEELLEKNLGAPSLWLIDAANALWRRTVRGELTQARAVERLTELAKAPVASVPLDQDLLEAMRLALQLGSRLSTMDVCRAHRVLSPMNGATVPRM